ncbi:MAG: glycosyltransferase [Saprospiraceae bacterium]|nr:glycosyltransferase [Saprospiraceae bacterium]
MSKNQRIKALWLASWWPRPDHKVLGIFTKRDAEAVALFCDLVVINAIIHPNKRFIVEESIDDKGYRIIIVKCPASNNPILARINLARGFFMGIKWTIQKGFKPNVIHLHIVTIAGMAAYFYKLKYKLPLFLSEHWSGFSMPTPPIGFFNKWLGKLLVRDSRGVFAVTKPMRDKMIQIGWQGQYLVNPNVVDTDFFTLGPKLSPSPFRFIHISSLDEEHKNMSGLLRAIRQAALQQPNFTMTIIGGDEGTAHVTQLAQSLGLEDKLRILGVQSAEVVQREMQASHAFVLFSNREGLPCVILEAMATGLPVISSSVPGLEEWVTQETGILVPIGDEGALTAALLKILQGHQCYDKNIIREKVVRECSYPVVGKRIAEAYEEAVAACRNRS